MILTGFNESNKILDRPDGMSVEECEPAQVWQGYYENGHPVIITCWKITKEELEEVQRTGRIWLTLHGHTMQPAYVGGISPFQAVAE